MRLLRSTLDRARYAGMTEPERRAAERQARRSGETFAALTLLVFIVGVCLLGLIVALRPSQAVDPSIVSSL